MVKTVVPVAGWAARLELLLAAARSAKEILAVANIALEMCMQLVAAAAKMPLVATQAAQRLAMAGLAFNGLTAGILAVVVAEDGLIQRQAERFRIVGWGVSAAAVAVV